MFGAAASQFRDHEVLIGIDEGLKDRADGDFPPAHWHVGIAAAEGDEVGLLFFMVMDRKPEVVVHVRVGDGVPKICHGLHGIETVVLRRHIEVPGVKVDADVRPRNTGHLLQQFPWILSITVWRMVEIGPGVLDADEDLGRFIGKIPDRACLSVQQ